MPRGCCSFGGPSKGLEGGKKLELVEGMRFGIVILMLIFTLFGKRK